MTYLFLYLHSLLALHLQYHRLTCLQHNSDLQCFHYLCHLPWQILHYDYVIFMHHELHVLCWNVYHSLHCTWKQFSVICANDIMTFFLTVFLKLLWTTLQHCKIYSLLKNNIFIQLTILFSVNTHHLKDVFN